MRCRGRKPVLFWAWFNRGSQEVRVSVQNAVQVGHPSHRTVTSFTWTLNQALFWAVLVTAGWLALPPLPAFGQAPPAAEAAAPPSTTTDEDGFSDADSKVGYIDN